MKDYNNRKALQLMAIMSALDSSVPGPSLLSKTKTRKRKKSGPRNRSQEQQRRLRQLNK